MQVTQTMKATKKFQNAYDKAYDLDRPKSTHKKTFEHLRQAVFEAVHKEEEASRQALYAFEKRMSCRNQKLERRLAGEAPA